MVIFYVDSFRPGPLNLELIDHNLVLIDATNPYGDIRFASITVKGRSKRFVRSTQIIEAWPCNFYIGSKGRTS
ncbi:hypothetical protein F4804DRAFT_311598 [Jackrogersella minutella]|nr:hypothetical protein F4804DRAFT_311598 [Jackrogersella minutella]